MAKPHLSPMTKDLLLIGKIVGVHGRKGYLKIRFWGEEGTKNWGRVFIFHGGEHKPFAVEDVKFHKGFLLLKLSGLTIKDEALQFKGSEVYIDKGALPELSEEEFYWFELEGLEVYTKDGDCLGTIKKILQTGSNDVFVVRDGEKEYLIPAIKNVILSIDKRLRRVVINPIEGLL